MRWLGSLLMIVGVSLGCYGASSAYHVPIDAPDELLLGERLNADAGARGDAQGQWQPVAKKNTLLNAAVLAELRKNARGDGNGASPWRYVRVKTFAWSRWPGRWLAVLGTSMLCAGAVTARRQRQSAPHSPAAEGTHVPVTADAFDKLQHDIDQLRQSVAQQGDAHSAARRICDGVDMIQRLWITPLVRSQAGFIQRQGVGRAAEALGQFAGVERQLNRAWSAAADGYLEDALAAISAADIHCRSAREKLASLERLAPVNERSN